MNRTYRHVWSAARGAYVIAAENARGRGKSGGAVKAIAPALAIVAGLALSAPSAAQQIKTPTSVVPSGGKTNAYVAPNGVPVVNIDTANAAGISHNQFSSYNVEANGLVLNNSPFSATAIGQSQLAGGIVGNTNLKDPAKIIMNEVVSANRSTLAGYTEVYGSRADVIVVNPNGITCTGCGFINTDRVTLSTGAPVWAADGSIIGFNVSGGDIAIGGSGLNASAQQILDLVARSVRLDGQVNVGATGELGIFTGPIGWNYAGRNIAGTVGVNDNKPQYAIDSTALGGMYAGRIRLIATEAGVGVRMLGDAAASADDFRVDAAGKVLVQSRISAARDITIAQTGALGADAIAISGANAALSAEHDLAISGDAGVTLTDAALKAANNLSITAATLADSSSTNATRSANGALAVNLSGAAAIDSSTWGAGAGFTLNADTLAITGATLYSGAVAANADKHLTLGANGDIAIDKSKLTSTDALTIASTQGALRFGADAALTAANGAGLRAATGIENAGSVLAGTDLALDGASVANSGLLQATNGLTIGAAQALALANTATGRALADHIALNATTLDNAGAVQATNGLTIAASGALTNQKTGALLDTGAGKDLAISAASMDNAGSVQSAGGLNAVVTGAAANSGQLLTTTAANGGADGAINLHAGSIDNTGTVSAAGAGLLKTDAGFVNRALVQGDTLALTVGAKLVNDGAASALVAQKTVTAVAVDVGNAGTIQAGTSLNVGASGSLTNANAIQTLAADGKLALSGGTVANIGTVQAGGTGALTSTVDTITNSGQIIAAGDLSFKAASVLANSGGAIQTAGDFSATGTQFVNGGTVSAGKNLVAKTTISVNNGGLLETTVKNGSLDLTSASMTNGGNINGAGGASLTATTGSIDNTAQVTAATALTVKAAKDANNTGAKALLSGATIAINAAGIANSGTMQAKTNLDALASAALTNSLTVQTTAANSVLALRGATLTNSGSIASSGAASVSTTAGALTNTSQIQAVGPVGLNAKTAIANSGQVIGQANVSLAGASGFTVDNSGRVQAATGLTLGTAALPAAVADNSGTLIGNTAGIYATNLDNSGRIQAAGAGTIQGGTIVNSASDAVILMGMDGSASTITGTSTVRNAGAIHTAGDLLVTAPRLDNTDTGGISSEANLTMNATGAGFDNDGALYAGSKLTVNALGQIINNTMTGTLDATNILVNGGTFNNYNTVIALGDTTINTTDAFNNLPTGRVPNIIIAQTIYGTVTLPYDWDGNCNIFGSSCDHSSTYAQSVTLIQGLDGAMPTQFGQIIAAGTLNINYGHAGLNQASLISAPTVNISGTGSFTNTDLHLEQIDNARRWHMDMTDSTFGSKNYTYSFPTSQSQYGCNDGGCFGGSAGSSDEAAAAATQIETGRTVIQKWKAGIYATNLTFTGGSLMNLGSPYQQGTASQAVSVENTVAANPLAGTPFAAAFGSTITKLSTTAKTVAVAATPTLGFQGLNLTLPTNPNGYFVTAKDPNSQYLVETNPLFGAGNNSVGSDYLTKLLNINPDQEIKRLGDANYEAKLVRDQLIAQTGSNILAGMDSEATQMQSLMDNAGTQAASLGLVYGQPPSAAQLANLKEDMVWMVETVVNGQTVVAPVVYLAQSTKDAIDSSGPTIAAKNATIKADTVTNTGGTIAGDNLAITAKGDVTNTGGTIKGGNVSVTSTEGSIVNQTAAQTNGGTDFARTVIGATGSIQSTGSLSLDAAKDITVKGANVSAGGDASLAAGGNVTFDTIQDKSADTTSKSTAGFLSKSSSSEHTATTTNIGSGLTTGGNLAIKSGGDTTIAGSQVKVGGDLALDATGNVNIISRQDTKETSSSSSHSGLGEGGGVYGTKTTTTDTFQGRNVASGIDVKGNADIKTDATLTLQGSKLNVDGSANLQADQVNVLAGQDVDRSTTKTETTSFLKFDGASGDSATGTAAQAGTGIGSAAGIGIGAAAGAGASASGSAGVTLAETKTTTTSDYNSKSVGSEINVGKNLTVNATKDITLQGAKVNTGGDATLNATDVKVLASQDVHTTSSTSSTKQIGLYANSNNDASANASANASGLNNSAQVGVEANSDTTLDFARTSTTKSDSLDVHNNGSTINAGGKLAVNATNTLSVQGSDLSGDKGASVTAQDMSFTAANDVHTESTSTTKSAAGLYVSGSASAGAGAQTGVLGDGASAEADAKAGEGWQARTSTASSASGTTTAQVSTIKSGSGDVTRTATGTISDVGTNIDAAGNFTQSATTIDSKAAANTSYATESTSSQQVRVGVYADASASAGATGAPEAAGAGVSVGLEASYKNNQSDASSTSSTAVVSNIKAGGKVSTTSTGTTSMEGTNISGAGGVEIGAKDLSYTAAHDTSSSTSSSQNINAAANVGIGLGDKTVEGGASGGFDKSKDSASSSTAVTGSIQSGAGLTVKTGNNASFEGTNIAATGDATVAAGGSLSMTAARDTSTASSTSGGAQVGVQASAGGAGVKADGSYQTANSSSNGAVVGSVKTGGNLTLAAGNTASFEGTQVGAGGATTVAAGTVQLKDAKSTSSSSSTGVAAGFAVSGGESGGAGMANVAVGHTSDSANTATATTLGGANGVQVKTGSAGSAAASAAQTAVAPAASTGIAIQAAPEVYAKPATLSVKSANLAVTPAATGIAVDVAPAVKTAAPALMRKDVPATVPAAVPAAAPADTAQAQPLTTKG